MFEFFYHNGAGRPNCLDNINGTIGKKYSIIYPVNLFMYIKIEANGKIAVLPPKSKSGDKIVLCAETDVRIGVASCRVSESACNSGKCTPIKLIVSDGDILSGQKK